MSSSKEGVGGLSKGHWTASVWQTIFSSYEPQISKQFHIYLPMFNGFNCFWSALSLNWYFKILDATKEAYLNSV